MVIHSDCNSIVLLDSKLCGAKQSGCLSGMADADVVVFPLVVLVVLVLILVDAAASSSSLIGTGKIYTSLSAAFATT